MGQVSPLAPFLSIAATFGRARRTKCRYFKRERDPTQVFLQGKTKNAANVIDRFAVCISVTLRNPPLSDPSVSSVKDGPTMRFDQLHQLDFSDGAGHHGKPVAAGQLGIGMGVINRRSGVGRRAIGHARSIRHPRPFMRNGLTGLECDPGRNAELQFRLFVPDMQLRQRRHREGSHLVRPAIRMHLDRAVSAPMDSASTTR